MVRNGKNTSSYRSTSSQRAYSDSTQRRSSAHARYSSDANASHARPSRSASTRANHAPDSSRSYRSHQAAPSHSQRRDGSYRSPRSTEMPRHSQARRTDVRQSSAPSRTSAPRSAGRQSSYRQERVPNTSNRRNRNEVRTTYGRHQQRDIYAGSQVNSGIDASGIIGTIISLAKSAFSFLGKLLNTIRQKSLPAFIVIVAIIGLFCINGVSAIAYAGKAHAGVHVGDVDVSGMNKDEITQVVQSRYNDPLSQNTVIIYANKESQQKLENIISKEEEAVLAEQLALEDTIQNKTLWACDKDSLGLSINNDQVVSDAMSVGRGGPFSIFSKIASRLFGSSVDVSLSFDDYSLEVLSNEIDQSIGQPKQEYGISISDGTASITEGYDGEMVDRNTMKTEISNSILSDNENERSFVAETVHTSTLTDYETASEACDQVNKALTNGAKLVTDSGSINVSQNEMGSWVSTRVETKNNKGVLVPYINESVAKPSIIQKVEQSLSGNQNNFTVNFTNNNNNIQVRITGSTTIPLGTQAVNDLNTALFGKDASSFSDTSKDLFAYAESNQSTELTSLVSGNPSAKKSSVDSPVEVNVGMGKCPETMNFNEALDYGIVGVISEYTTEYTNISGTEARNHNIQLAASLINNSITSSQGMWSFNEVAGETGEAQGFQAAGTIIDGEYSQDYGGGICQVATTVFNAVFESGLPVNSRTNHSLYIASYPAGRDAAVSWPDLDLKWTNETSSDILLQTETTDTSITVTLYGISPNYTVKAEQGEWEEGEKYKTVVKINEELPESYVYKTVTGEDGRQIYVIRRVYNKEGQQVREDSFVSVYEPKNEVYEAGSEEAASKVDTSNSSTS